ncbi:MAG: hypothetical protein BroJett024_38090 [Alphaproteobacteria bacterium]|nr:MAG: hypothetical protein BroJett024_38090 [Alphaproteobacteria bacterium]
MNLPRMRTTVLLAAIALGASVMSAPAGAATPAPLPAVSVDNGAVEQAHWRGDRDRRYGNRDRYHRYGNRHWRNYGHYKGRRHWYGRPYYADPYYGWYGYRPGPRYYYYRFGW